MGAEQGDTEFLLHLSSPITHEPRAFSLLEEHTLLQGSCITSLALPFITLLQ